MIRPHGFRHVRSILTFMICLTTIDARAVRSDSPAIEKTEFVFESAPFASCHASTIADSAEGLVAAWFGGSHEKNPDVGIWVSRKERDRWSAPAEVADGRQDDGKRYPCWNPVLFQAESRKLLLFYKVGPSPDAWWGMLKESTDAGRSWSVARRLPDGILGPIKNKPVRLADGSLLCPSSTEDSGWRVHFERTSDLGTTWKKSRAIGDGRAVEIIQPTILTHSNRRYQALCRSQQGRIVETWSSDNGKTWGAPALTNLLNPDSGIDAVTLGDGRHVLIYNPTGKGRTPLGLAVSADGMIWKSGPVLESEPGEYSYPAVIQSSDGKIHVTYTWKRERIKHVVVDPEKLLIADLPDIALPPR